NDLHREARSSCVVVVDGGQQIVGMLTERDIVRLSAHRLPPPHNLTAPLGGGHLAVRQLVVGYRRVRADRSFGRSHPSPSYRVKRLADPE
ncbi:MAG: hypothetical protein AAFY67_06300, partial [Cyanobacteria bacterium J06642_9]